jgi:hypothetical protein
MGSCFSRTCNNVSIAGVLRPFAGQGKKDKTMSTYE